MWLLKLCKLSEGEISSKHIGMRPSQKAVSVVIELVNHRSGKK